MAKTLSNADKVVIFDTTMRDGEQSPGASMTIREKLELAELLQEMKVDICEAGFAASSEGDFQCVSQIAELARDMVICSLARSTLTDIDRAGEAVKKARQPRIHTFISTSPIHMKHKLNMEAHQVLDAVSASVTLARKFTDDVEWSAEDATRTERDFLKRRLTKELIAAAILDLRDEEREIFLLRQNGDLTYEQIAELRDIPVGTVKTIYAKVGRVLTLEAEAAMRAWVAKNPREHRPPHEYSAEKFGLSRERIERVAPTAASVLPFSQLKMWRVSAKRAAFERAPSTTTATEATTMTAPASARPGTGSSKKIRPSASATIGFT